MCISPLMDSERRELKSKRILSAMIVDAIKIDWPKIKGERLTAVLYSFFERFEKLFWLSCIDLSLVRYFFVKFINYYIKKI